MRKTFGKNQASRLAGWLCHMGKGLLYYL